MLIHIGIIFITEKQIKNMKSYITYTMLTLILLLLHSCKETVTIVETKDDVPTLFPDYAGVTVPATIAPLNFTVKEEFSKIDALIEGSLYGSLHVQGRKSVEFPKNKWMELLRENNQGVLNITVSIKTDKGWIRYAPFQIYVSPFPIDYSLTYRLIAPGYELYSSMGIYQRDLSSFSQTALIENTILPGSCLNCHSFCAGNPEQMSMHIRGTHGATMIMNGKAIELYETKTEQTGLSCVYPYWHPSGKYIAYSVNSTQQIFHTALNKRIEVLDLKSDLVVYNIETNELFSCPQLSSESEFETFPSFSPDGKSLYFCTADKRAIPDELDSIKYNLCRIDFDPKNGTFGQTVDTLVSAKEWNKSVSFPRPSYDGKYLMYTLSDYGNFSIWHKEADLWLLNLETNETRELNEVNSDDVESYHSWSTNSRWFVFSSRRLDGLYTRPFIASINDDGTVTKPFLLPQNDVEYYSDLLYSFNIPEFVSAPVDLNIRQLEKKALSEERIKFKYKD